MICLGWLAHQMPAHASQGWRMAFLPIYLQAGAMSMQGFLSLCSELAEDP